MENPCLGDRRRRGYRADLRKNGFSPNGAHVPRMPLLSAHRRISSLDPFGNILSKSGPLADANTYRFSSQDYHQPSGLSLYLYRAYDVNLQRWLNRDPIAEMGGINLYQYCLNDPVEWNDPFGLDVPRGGTVLIHLNDGHPAGFNPLGVLWNLPNSALGALWGALSMPLGAKPSFGNNALQFEDHPFMPWGNMTLGNVICYNKDQWPQKPLTPENPYTEGDHERQHTYQGELLGPFYFPAYGIGMIGGILNGRGPIYGNFMETGPFLPERTSPPVSPRPWP